jgi:uncharacterized repeat protein (TIGR03803 family)
MKHLLVGAFASLMLLASPEAQAAKESVVYSFCSEQNCADGATPYAGLVSFRNRIYGTASGGGTSQSGGVVFSLDPKNGSETAAYAFCSQTGCTDGFDPQAGLTKVGDVLYGATVHGGLHDGGAVFSLDPRTGVETTLYSFCTNNLDNCSDGESPYSRLLYIGGTLYGTTQYGGNNFADCESIPFFGCGILFSVNARTGAETPVYSFCSQQDCADGASPESGLIAVNGVLYGVTVQGGESFAGAVFSVNPKTASETVLHSFCSEQECLDGLNPIAGLVKVGDLLYGATISGGAYWRVSEHGGTIFSVNPRTGSEHVMYSFCRLPHCKDGEGPIGDLIDVNGVLYGTTAFGGREDGACGGSGCGTVYSLDPKTGAEKVLHSFCGQTSCKDGVAPRAGLINVGDELYGTTVWGGANGRGAVFKVSLR